MDQPTANQFPNIAELSAQLASNNARVSAMLDSLPGSVDELVSAVLRQDWAEVSRVSDEVAQSAEATGQPVLGESARLLAETAGQGDDPLQIKRRAIKLIGACGRAKRPQ